MRMLRFVPGFSMLIQGCVAAGPCIEAEWDVPWAAAASPLFFSYTGGENPYELGELSVRTFELERCRLDAPAPLRIHSPEAPGAYPVVVFQHGFMTRNSAYDGVLRHLAGHGFIVIAPQMYEPGLSALGGNPTFAEEARLSREILDWIPGNLDQAAGVTARADRLGIAGHSRGALVAWTVAAATSDRLRAIAGVDPVGGRGRRASDTVFAAAEPFPFELPTLILGAELGGSCAPAGSNYVQFFERSRSPAWRVLALNQGHADMLDDPVASAASFVCTSGNDRPGMRRLTAGLMTALFRAALQGDESAYEYLSDRDGAPIAVEVESK